MIWKQCLNNKQTIIYELTKPQSVERHQYSNSKFITWATILFLHKKLKFQNLLKSASSTYISIHSGGRLGGSHDFSGYAHPSVDISKTIGAIAIIAQASLCVGHQVFYRVCVLRFMVILVSNKYTSLASRSKNYSVAYTLHLHCSSLLLNENSD
jgi:hypothetical protein